MPYAWLNSVLGLLAMGTLVGAVAYVAAAIFRGKGKRQRSLLAAGCCLAGFLLLGIANYALIFLVQLPALAREPQQAMQDRIDAVSLVKLGDEAPSFRIKPASGSEFSLDELRGKVVLLNFFATWDDLQSLQTELARQLRASE